MSCTFTIPSPLRSHGEPVTDTVNGRVALIPFVSVTRAVKLYVATVEVGVPVTAQAGPRVSPDPASVPLETEQVNGLVPPLIESACEYAIPDMAFGNVTVEIDGTALTVTGGEIDAMLLAVAVIVGEYMAAALSVPDSRQLDPVAPLHPLSPAGRPLDVHVIVPPLHVVIMVCDITCVFVHGPNVAGEIEHAPGLVPVVKVNHSVSP